MTYTNENIEATRKALDTGALAPVTRRLAKQYLLRAYSNSHMSREVCQQIAGAFERHPEVDAHLPLSAGEVADWFQRWLQNLAHIHADSMDVAIENPVAAVSYAIVMDHCMSSDEERRVSDREVLFTELSQSLSIPISILPMAFNKHMA